MDKYGKRYLALMIYYTLTHSGHYTVACYLTQDTELKPIFGQLMRLCLKAALIQGITITRYETTPMVTKTGDQLTVNYNLHLVGGHGEGLFQRIKELLEEQPGIEELAGYLE